MRPVIYARQSLDRSGEALAVSRQLSDCRSLVERNGWETAAEYVDNDVSASDGKPRAEWSRLLTDFSAGRFDTVVCWHTDRLYRRLIDLVSLIELAERQA
ncbi:MAG: recombinase family protein, partial [Geodermatophilaceae bacterium]|nr:recombinase family protein [Geodermatophilaceae bacterium]